jgi:AbrB family looped-hinge helix DNA binding protein
MKVTIDAAGRLVIPKALRDELGFSPDVELEVTAVDGHLEVAIPSRVRVEQGPHGVRFTAEAVEPLTAEQVRQVIERGRR